MSLLDNPVFLLLVILVLGELLGLVRLGPFALGSSAILLVAIAFGYGGYELPSFIQTLGLILFIYSIGLQAGPGFLSSLRNTGLRLSLGAVALVLLGFVTCVAVCLVMGYGPALGAGLFAGALTSTPGLAVAVELTGDPAAASAYGLTYLFGVIGVILYVKLLPALLRVNLKTEEAEMGARAAAAHPPIMRRHIQVNNPNIFGRKVRDLDLHAVAAVTLTRILPQATGEADMVGADTVLAEGDKLRVVGTQRDLEKIEMFIGPRIEEDIQLQEDLAARNIIVSAKEVVGRSLGSMNLPHVFNVRISRVRRSGFEITPHRAMRFRRGDVLTVVGNRRSVAMVAKLFGDDVEKTYSADVFSLVAGSLLGFLLGQIPIPIPGLGEIRLGITGGVLLSGLTLGGLYNTGRVIWALPAPANGLLRQLGLMLFLATVGTSAGATLVPTLASQGTGLLVSGALVTLVPLLGGVVLCRKVLGLELLRTMGVITGAMTSTPGLAAASALSSTQFASGVYATVYPIALVAMIVFSKLLVAVLGWVG
jgi:putative transport protein